MCMRVILVVLLLSMLLTVVAHAGTYYAYVSAPGTYTQSNAGFSDVNFGRHFSSIQSLSIRWRGQIQAGLCEDGLGGYETHGAGFEASLMDGGQSWQTSSTPYYGSSTYPSPESFDVTTQFRMASSSDLSFLLDGMASIRVQLFAPLPLSPFVASQEPTGSFTGPLVIIANGTLVPEPASLMGLFCGMGMCSAGMLRRRR